MCLDTRSQWTEYPTLGTVWSVAIYHRAYHPGFQHYLPYAVVLVDLDCRVRYLAGITGVDIDAIHPDVRVRGAFVEVEPDLTLMEFTLA
jgi:uncharacterized OB-fold protein